MKKVDIIELVCENMDWWHEKEHISYLIVSGFSLFRKLELRETSDGDIRRVWTFNLVEDANSFIMLDDPEEMWLTAIIGRFTANYDCTLLRYLHTCVHCQRKGVKQSKDVAVMYAGGV